jgi:ribosomal protein S18 acetylase RimI-like enzyme
MMIAERSVCMPSADLVSPFIAQDQRGIIESMNGGAEIVVRAFCAADREQVLALAPRLAEGVASWRDPDAVMGAVREWLTGSMASNDPQRSAVYVAVDRTSDRVVGVNSVSQSRHFSGEEDAYIGELAVAQNAGRGGVGSRLVAAASSWAKERGLRCLTLHTGAANTTARTFYEALGFRDEDVRLTLVTD